MSQGFVSCPGARAPGPAAVRGSTRRWAAAGSRGHPETQEQVSGAGGRGQPLVSMYMLPQPQSVSKEAAYPDFGGVQVGGVRQ